MRDGSAKEDRALERGAELIAALHKRFPTLTLSLEFFERGCAFFGGVTFCHEDDHYGDEPWKAGAPSASWEGKYLGERGG